MSVDILLFDILRLRYFAFDILRFVILLYDILCGTRSNHTDAAERISKVLTEVAGSMFGGTELDVYHRWASLIQKLVPLIVGPLLYGLVSLTAGPLT